jgi:hypothetical protein
LHKEKTFLTTFIQSFLFPLSGIAQVALNWFPALFTWGFRQHVLEDPLRLHEKSIVFRTVGPNFNNALTLPKLMASKRANLTAPVKKKS